MMKARLLLPLLLLVAGCTRTVPADVSSFVARVKRTALDPVRHDPRALEFYQEAEALRDRYAAVCQWPSLEAVRQELVAYLNAHQPVLARWNDKIEELRRGLAQSISLGDFQAASCRLDDFGRRFGEARDAKLARWLEEQRDLLERRSVVWANQQCSEAFSKRGLGLREEARRILRCAYDGLEGYADAREQIQMALNDLGN